MQQIDDFFVAPATAPASKTKVIPKPAPAATVEEWAHWLGNFQFVFLLSCLLRSAATFHIIFRREPEERVGSSLHENCGRGLIIISEIRNPN